MVATGVAAVLRWHPSRTTDDLGSDMKHTIKPDVAVDQLWIRVDGLVRRVFWIDRQWCWLERESGVLDKLHIDDVRASLGYVGDRALKGDELDDQ